MKLSALTNGEEGVIVKVKGHGAFRKRITEMGFVKGKKVEVIKNAPLRDPVEYKIMDYQVSLRRAEAALIEVVTTQEASEFEHIPFNGTISDEVIQHTVQNRQKTIQVALVGNPNCGKTTIFNHASGSYERVGNYSGVTVESKLATFKQNGYTFNIVDLPGTYSLSAFSPEELYVRNYIMDEAPDVVINVLDASNLERNLYLTTQLMDMDINVVAALNMYDELEKSGDKLDYSTLGKMLGIPFVPTVGYKEKGIEELFNKVIEVYEDNEPTVRRTNIHYGQQIEEAISTIDSLIIGNEIDKHIISKRFFAIKSIEKDKQINELATKWLSEENNKKIEKLIKALETSYHEDSETYITDYRYGFIAGALKETMVENPRERRRNTELIDKFLTHKLWGFPIFFFFIWVMFETTFSLGSYPMDWIDAGVGLLSEFVAGLMPDGSLKSLIVDGIIGGVGGVIIFLPNILILFFFISFMEDTGYMARAAFIMDKVMHKLGLHGKSFIPLLIGFGCNVPSVMATRTIEDRNSRLLTMLISPFMSCSARLPVYILILAAFFPENSGTLLFVIYIIGILIAVLMARLFKRFLFKGQDVPFVMELPPYRIPTMKSTFLHMWHKGEQYIKKMGGIIMVASIIIWFLSYYPQNVTFSKDFDSEIAQTTQLYESKINQTTDLSVKEVLQAESDSLVNILAIQQHSEHQRQSYIGQMGRFIEPVIAPLGFDWKMGISLLTGIAAKEIVVSTMAVIYQSGGDIESDSSGLIQKFRDDKYEDGTKVFTPWVAFSFIIFTLIYFPCVAVVAAIKKESGSWKWALFSIVYSTGLAYTLSLIIFNIGKLFS